MLFLQKIWLWCYLNCRNCLKPKCKRDLWAAPFPPGFCLHLYISTRRDLPAFPRWLWQPVLWAATSVNVTQSSAFCSTSFHRSHTGFNYSPQCFCEVFINWENKLWAWPRSFSKPYESQTEEWGILRPFPEADCPGRGHKESSGIAGDPNRDISHRTTWVYLLLLGKCQTQSKYLVNCVVLFCFPELKLNLSYYFTAFSEIRLELIFSITFQITSSEWWLDWK